jgi:hypothetical protein
MPQRYVAMLVITVLAIRNTQLLIAGTQILGQGSNRYLVDLITHNRR